MNFDPIKTMLKLKRYNLPAPPCFEERYIQLNQFDELFTQRADFVKLNPVFGEEVEEQIEQYLYDEIKEGIIQKKMAKKFRDIEDHIKLVKDIE